MLAVKFSGKIKFEPDCTDCRYLVPGRKSYDRYEPDEPDECKCADKENECPEVLRVTERIGVCDVEEVEAELC
jgi:hypothetical protein